VISRDVSKTIFSRPRQKPQISRPRLRRRKRRQDEGQDRTTCFTTTPRPRQKLQNYKSYQHNNTDEINFTTSHLLIKSANGQCTHFNSHQLCFNYKFTFNLNNMTAKLGSVFPFLIPYERLISYKEISVPQHNCCINGKCDIQCT